MLTIQAGAKDPEIHAQQRVCVAPELDSKRLSALKRNVLDDVEQHGRASERIPTAYTVDQFRERSLRREQVVHELQGGICFELGMLSHGHTPSDATLHEE
jgi:hypothetical protein